KKFSVIIEGYCNQEYYIVFNLTGGFKSVQGFLQTLAMFYADEAIYIFETGTELLRIPRLPLQMSPGEIITEHFKIIRRLALHLPVEIEETKVIPETLLLSMGSNVALSPWGEVIYKQTKKGLYNRKVWPSPSFKLKYSTKFNKSVENLNPSTYNDLNLKIDLLSQTLELGDKYNLKTLDFKKLRENPVPGSTHEFDASHDKGAPRVYGHYEDGLYVLDKFDKHL